MGTFSHPIEVIAADGSRSVTVDALVDTGSTYTCLPASLMRELGIVPYRRIRSELADGSVVEDDLGIAHVRVQDIYTPTLVIFAAEGAPALLGAYTLEGALLMVDPVGQRLRPTHALRYQHLRPAAATRGLGSALTKMYPAWIPAGAGMTGNIMPERRVTLRRNDGNVASERRVTLCRNDGGHRAG